MIDRAALIQFEEEIADLYNKGVIKAPVHLRSGNEWQLLEIFKLIKPTDSVFCTWASHLEAILHQIPQHLIKAKIIEGKSISLNFPGYNFFSSAIVGHTAVWATGAADTIKRLGQNSHVWAFIGDMGFRHPDSQAAIDYARGHKLPITFVVADNEKSVCTETEEVWASKTFDKILQLGGGGYWRKGIYKSSDHRLLYFQYHSSWPHSGAGKFVDFKGF